jgi:fibro-slime domain-containing protein
MRMYRCRTLALSVLGGLPSLMAIGCGGEDASGAGASEIGMLPGSPPATPSVTAGTGSGGAPGTVGSGTQPSDEPVGGFDLDYMPIAPSGGAAGTANCEPNLTGIVRDFRASSEAMGHGDFEKFEGRSASKGIVKPDLGTDKKPVYAPTAALMDPQNGPQTTTAEAYNQWYRDTPGVNQSTEFQIMLGPSGTPGVLTFDDGTFFPIDGQLFGNFQNGDHNFHFTFELHTTFTYNGGEVFTFTGDDDLWVFINNKLAIDLGGLHPQLSESVSLDAVAGQFGIAVGGSYPLDLFHAERHTNESHFRIDTSIAFTNCEPIILR